jgi:AcrR family transcriptional regulator
MSRQARKAASRQQLLRRGLARVRRQGFGNVATADVAKDAGLSHGALFVHFPTRDALLAEIASTLGREITDALYAKAAGGSDLASALRAHLAAIQLHENAYRSLLIESADAGPLQTIWTGIQSAVAVHLSGALERALNAAGRSSVTLPVLFNMWLGLVHHYVLNGRLLSSGRSALEEHGATLVRTFVNLISGDPSR